MMNTCDEANELNCGQKSPKEDEQEKPSDVICKLVCRMGHQLQYILNQRSESDTTCTQNTYNKHNLEFLVRFGIVTQFTIHQHSDQQLNDETDYRCRDYDHK